MREIWQKVSPRGRRHLLAFVDTTIGMLVCIMQMPLAHYSTATNVVVLASALASAFWLASAQTLPGRKWPTRRSSIAMLILSTLSALVLLAALLAANFATLGIGCALLIIDEMVMLACLL